jgi:hypothetical protein
MKDALEPTEYGKILNLIFGNMIAIFQP